MAIRPGQEQIFEIPGWQPGAADKVFAWVLFPQTITYQDGTKWSQPREGECYDVFWRDTDHPDLPTLPPLFIEVATPD